MPKTTINPDNKPVDPSKFPKLKLTKGEKARVLLLDMEPETNWVHNLEMPKIEDGEVLTKIDNRQQEVYDTVWKGNPICLGDYDTVTDKGSDPDGCPACAAHREHGDMFDAPKRRYALPIIQYLTTPDGKLTQPFMCKVVVWAFTDNVFAQLCDLQEEHGDLKLHDILLGPCENQVYQKFGINIGGEAKWLETNETKKTTVTVWKEQQPTDLVALCGKNSRADWINTDIADIKKRWAEVRVLEGRGPASTVATDLLATTQAATAEQAVAPAPEVPSSGPVDLEALMNLEVPAPAVAEPTGVEAIDAGNAPEIGNAGVGTGEEIDLDAILDGMK